MADFKLEVIKNKDAWYEVIIKATTGMISLTKEFRVYKTVPRITFIYKITTTHQEHNIEVEIESNTNISCLQENNIWFEINGCIKKISGITEVSRVQSLKIFNRADNIVQTIRIEPEQNRLVIHPRYSVSQGLRLFEITLQYIRYSFIVPLCIMQDTPGKIIISHSLDSHAREEEEDEWIKGQYEIGGC